MNQVAYSFMSIFFRMRRAECKTCTHSEGRAIPGGCVLQCMKHDKPATDACMDYLREPGSEGDE